MDRGELSQTALEGALPGSTDREILLMRHMEGLNYAEIACLLSIEAGAARKRYGRALLRLRKVLKDHGLLEPAS